jgi:hypothetical protein
MLAAPRESCALLTLRQRRGRRVTCAFPARSRKVNHYCRVWGVSRADDRAGRLPLPCRKGHLGPGADSPGLRGKQGATRPLPPGCERPSVGAPRARSGRGPTVRDRARGTPAFVGRGCEAEVLRRQSQPRDASAAERDRAPLRRRARLPLRRKFSSSSWALMGVASGWLRIFLSWSMLRRHLPDRFARSAFARLG